MSSARTTEKQKMLSTHRRNGKCYIRISVFCSHTWFQDLYGSTALYAEEKNYSPDYKDNRIVPTGRRTYPRYFKLVFTFNRAKYPAQPRPIDPEKIELQIKVIELRSKGLSYPAIAKFLNISVGTTWDLARHKI
jgi:hypothetical protein